MVEYMKFWFAQLFVELILAITIVGGFALVILFLIIVVNRK
jgi:hypothetical protein